MRQRRPFFDVHLSAAVLSEPCRLRCEAVSHGDHRCKPYHIPHCGYTHQPHFGGGLGENRLETTLAEGESTEIDLGNTRKGS